jgi:cytoskeletal protein RodZ
MKIQKSKLKQNREWSETTKARLAAALGISALVSLTSCTKAPAPGNLETSPEQSVTSEAAGETPSNPLPAQQSEAGATTEAPLSSSSISSSSEEDPGPTAGMPYYDYEEEQRLKQQQQQ